MKITKEEFDKLYSDTISKREYDSIIDKIDDRFEEIVETLLPRIHTGRGWYTYSNVDYRSENAIGYFDIDEYKEYIQIGGECINLPPPYEEALIPTRWLWEEDFKQEFDRDTEKEKIKILKDKENEKSKREARKAKCAEFRRVIEGKLTKEELRYVKFKV